MKLKMNILFILLFTFSGILIPKTSELEMPEDYKRTEINYFQKEQKLVNSENKMNKEVKSKKSISIIIDCSL